MSEQNNYANASLQDVFLAALDKSSAAERAAFLDAACGVDSDRRRKIEALLSNHAHDGFLEQPAVVGPAETNPRSGCLAEDLGTSVRGFKLLEQIGEGGCGVVYVAEQQKPVRRRVALKIIKLGMDTRSVVARFEAERQTLALMDHPNIAKVLDAGATESGRPYFVMELVRGIRITDYCDRCKLPPRQRIELFIKVCYAVQHAHQKGIIHRDIKPSNILVTLYDGVPVPKVIDFGIAKATNDMQLTDKTVYTQLHQFIGTPAYTSPEQAELSGLDIDTRSDIYSLGVLVYEMLVGKTPFDVKALLASGLDEIRRTIREEDPVRPSTRLRTMLAADQSTTAQHRGVEVSRLVHLLSGDLDWIVMKCLEKDRSRRYATATGLAMDLQRYLNQEPVLAHAPSAAYRVRKFVRRNKVMVGAGSAIAVALVLGFLSSMWQAVRATRAEREQISLREDAETAREDEARLRKLAQAQAYAADMKAAQVALQQENRGMSVDLLRQYLPKPGEEDLRGVEWRYLWHTSRSDEEMSFAHPTMVDAAVMTPGGRHLATIDVSGILRVWEIASARRIVESEPKGQVHIEISRRLDCSADGKWLALAGSNFVEIWDTTHWRVARRLERVTRPIRFSPDSKTLATHGTNGLWLWDLHTGTHRELTNAMPITTSMAFSPDGTQMVSASGAGGSEYHLQFWNLRTGMEISRTPMRSRNELAISPDGQWLACGNLNGEVILWDLASQTEDLRFRAHPIVYSLAFSPDGNYLATGGSDQQIHVWDIGTTNRVATLQGHSSEIWSLGFSWDGQTLFSSSKDGTAKLWRVAGGRTRIQSLSLPTNSVTRGTLPDGSALVTLNSDERTTQLWSVPDGQLRHSLAWNQFEEAGCSTFWHLPANQLVAGRTASGTFHFWSLRTGGQLRSVELGATNLVLVALSLDNHWLLGKLPNEDLALHDLSLGKPVQRFVDRDRDSYFARGSFSPDGRWLAYSMTNNAVKVWDLAANRAKAILDGPKWHLSPIQWSPDSQILTAGGWDGEVWMWSVEDWKPLFSPLKGHQSSVSFAVFSSDGRTLITQSTDKATRCWSVATGREMLLLKNHRKTWGIMQMAPPVPWDLGGKHLVWEEAQGNIQVMTLPTLVEIDADEQARNTRNLASE